jgi:four helix bundle protein
MGNFEHLEVWAESKNLAVSLYKTTNTGLISKDFGLRDQIRRAAVSVPSNIAEGEESGRNKKGINYFYISKGSLAELITQITIAFEIGYLDLIVFEEYNSKINTLSGKLRKLIQYREQAIHKS